MVEKTVTILIIMFFASSCGEKPSIGNNSNLDNKSFDIAYNHADQIFINLNNKGILSNLTDEERSTLKQQITDEVASAVQQAR